MQNRKNVALAALSLLFLIMAGSSLNRVYAQDDEIEMATFQVVGEAEIASGEIIADRDANRDINGNLTAGLRITTDLTGLQFTSNNGIHRTQQLPGAILLYLSTNERIVEVYKAGYSPLQIVLSDQGIDLESGKVWEIKITGNQKTTSEPVRFNVTPSNTTIIIDGEEEVISGTQHDTNLSTGEHVIQLRKERHSFIDDTINVTANTFNSYDYNLEEIDPIQVLINSNPEGASIYINDSPGSVGTTPRYENLYPGDLKVTLRLEGYTEYEEEFEFTGQQDEFNFNLQKYSGYLDLDITPEDAIVFINGDRFQAEGIGELTPGVKTYEIRANGYDPQTGSFEIPLEDTLSQSFTLNQITGNLFVTAQQPEATLTLTREGQIVETWKGGNTFRDLPVGNYQLRAELTNFRTETRSVEITRNSEVDEDFDLTQIAGQGTFQMDGLFRDAKVRIQGPRFSRSYSKLPITEQSLPFGSYKITIKKDGFENITKDLKFNSLSQDMTVVDEFQPKTKGKAILRSVFIPGLGHGYLDKRRSWLYFLGTASAVGWTISSYSSYQTNYDEYVAALNDYNSASTGADFNRLRTQYEEAHSAALESKDALETGLLIIGALKGIELIDLLLIKSNKKKLEEAKVQFNAKNSGLSLRVNF